MDAKWPFALMTLGLFVLLGFVIAQMDRKSVMAHWATRRCELPVMAAGSFFKPELDPRTNGQFAKDNFEFCMKRVVDGFINLFMAPVNALFGKQVNLAGGAMGALNGIRNIAQVLYNTFSAYLAQYFRRFSSSFSEVSRMIQHLRNAASRISAIALSLVYAGLSFFRGMINAIQVVIRVVLIICAIMLIIIILLWFILFPVIPIIMSALTAVVITVMAMAGILSASLSADAADKKGGFCFATGSSVATAAGTTPVEDIKVGTELAHGCGTVSTVIIMEGDSIPLYDLKGILVSASHLVKGRDGRWKSVSEDDRAIPTDKKSEKIYCFNTTSNNIPLRASDDSIVLFRDWEEIANDDDNGQYIWNYMVSSILNKGAPYHLWEGNLRSYCENALVSQGVEVKTADGFVPIKDIQLSDLILDETGEEQVVRGIVEGEMEGHSINDEWVGELYVLKDGVWIREPSTLSSGERQQRGYSLMTEKGAIVIRHPVSKEECVIRDFTEVGYQMIHETYSFVETRLRMTESNKII
jgi:hypothetical protein